MPAPRPLISILGPLLVAIAVIAMLVWTWNKCPDPVIDYGREVYVPWRITQGQVLYRDINYFNGPLAPYLDALLFKLFGPTIRTLKIFSAIVIMLLAALIYAMARAMSDDWAATVAGILFPILFACQQIAGATFNFLTPYSYDLSLGVALSIAMVACFCGAAVTGRKTLWLGLAATLLGLIFLTKAEVFLAALISAIAGLACLLWSIRPTPARVVRHCAAFAALTFAPILLALIALSVAMPILEATSALAGAWRWLGDPQLTNMHFVRWLTGIHAPAISSMRILGWAGAYVAILCVACGVGALVREKRPAAKSLVASIAAVCIAAPVAAFWSRVPWVGFLSPLPLFVLGTLIGILVLLRRIPRSRASTLSLPAAFAALSGGLLLKIFFNVHSYHYGFALAMPAGFLAIVLLVGWTPAWLERRRHGAGFASRIIIIAALLAAGYAHVRWNAAWIGRRINLVSAGGDSFYADAYGPIAQRAMDYLLANTSPRQTLVCMPEGLLMNFMTRRVNPTPDLNYSPPALIMYGEPNMLSRLREHPPDWVAVVGTDDSIYRPAGKTGSWFFGEHFALDIAKWLGDEYEFVQLFGEPPFTSHKPGILLMRRRAEPEKR